MKRSRQMLTLARWDIRSASHLVTFVPSSSIIPSQKLLTSPSMSIPTGIPRCRYALPLSSRFRGSITKRRGDKVSPMSHPSEHWNTPSLVTIDPKAL